MTLDAFQPGVEGAIEDAENNYFMKKKNCWAGIQGDTQQGFDALGRQHPSWAPGGSFPKAKKES